jgi:hypothetical protein
VDQRLSEAAILLQIAKAIEDIAVELRALRERLDEVFPKVEPEPIDTSTTNDWVAGAC